MNEPVPQVASVREYMTTDVVVFHGSEIVDDAISMLVKRSIHGAPVVDADGCLQGILTDDDLVVGESRLHIPTIFSVFGESAMWPPSVRRFKKDAEKAVAARVDEAMSREVITIGPSATVEDAATLMHEHGVTMLPVIDGAKIVGVISRGDILRFLAQR